MKPGQGTGKSLPKVLIVEDHAATRKTLRQCIRANFPGVRVHEADCGEDALALAAKEHPEIVLMDYRLRGINGIEAARCIRVRVPHCCVVMVSSHENEEYRARAAAANAGAAAFIAKRNLPANLVLLLDELVPRFARAAEG